MTEPDPTTDPPAAGELAARTAIAELAQAAYRLDLARASLAALFTAAGDLIPQARPDPDITAALIGNAKLAAHLLARLTSMTHTLTAGPDERSGAHHTADLLARQGIAAATTGFTDARDALDVAHQHLQAAAR